LGVVTDTCDPRHLCTTIEETVTGDMRRLVDGGLLSGFLAAMTPQRFASEIFASLLSA
jgi:hypothetical protein